MQVNRIMFKVNSLELWKQKKMSDQKIRLMQVDQIMFKVNSSVYNCGNKRKCQTRKLDAIF